jgi:hypothetical protein
MSFECPILVFESVGRGEILFAVETGTFFH